MSRFRRRLMMAAGNGPKGTPLAWIQSDYTQMIVLPVTLRTLGKLLVYLDESTVNDTSDRMLFGGRESNAQDINFRMYSSGTRMSYKLYEANSQKKSSYVYKTTGFVAYGVDRTGSSGIVYAGGNNVGTYTKSSFTSSAKIGLFDHNRNTTGYAPIAVRISKVEITDTSGATYTLLPYLNPDGIPGLYDEKRKVWYMDSRGGNPFGYEE